jgi:hypothetical protein
MIHLKTSKADEWKSKILASVASMFLFSPYFCNEQVNQPYIYVLVLRNDFLFQVLESTCNSPSALLCSTLFLYESAWAAIAKYWKA